MKPFHSRTTQIKSSINKLYRGLRLYYLNHSIKAWWFLFRHLFLKAFKKDIPNIITIGLTYRCQCKCVHCSSNIPNRKQTPELKTWEVKSIIDQAKKLGVVRVTLFGGEPLLRNDIVELTQYAHKAGMITRINTNGWLLSRELISKLKDAGLNLCDVSIDDPDPETHDKLRGLPGIFNKATEGIKILKEFSILCQIVTYAAKKNVTAGLEKIISLGKHLGVFAVSIVFPIATGCWQNKNEVLLTEQEKEKVRKLGDSAFVHIELPTPTSICNVCKKASIYVSPEGDVTPCPFIPYSIGNIKREPLYDIWHKFCAGWNLKAIGTCPMNDNQCREALKNLAIA
jgi:MoaA/NifB/PqqE/SkfB family radical SAM enzyme